jgi:hypothetical protein
VPRAALQRAAVQLSQTGLDGEITLMNQDRTTTDEVDPPATIAPNRALEAAGTLTCHRCSAAARWHPWGDAWIAACTAHAPEDDHV